MLVRTREFDGESQGLLGQLGYDVRPGRGRGFELHLWGPLPQAWAASLGVGLSASGIRVLRGFARRLDAETWFSEFELEALDDSEVPVMIDYLAMARKPLAELASPPVQITSHHRSMTARHGGSLYLEVRASDRFGFLGGLLRPIAALGLVPEELEIDTQGEPVLDRFFLKRVDGGVPDAADRRALRGLLDRLKR